MILRTLFAVSVIIATALFTLTGARAETNIPPAAPDTCMEIPANPGLTEAKRVALVIGNASYTGGIPALKNPANDAAGVASALSGLGFSVFMLTDGTGQTMRTCAARVREALSGDGIAMIYYSGHGIQIDDRNYMIATDAVADGQISDAYVYIDDVIDSVKERAASILVFLDACRNNPFAPEGAQGLSVSTGRGIERGLKKAEPLETEARQQAQGIFVAYSTSPNATATDGTGSMSPFTEAFVNSIGKPGYSVQRALSEVSKSVGEATDWSQTPWIKSSLTAEIMLNGSLTLEEALTVSEKHASESYRRLAAGDVRGAITEALKGLPMPLPADAETRFAKAYLALVAATRSTSYRLNLTEAGWYPSGYSPLTQRVIGNTWGSERVLSLWDAIKGVKIADLAAIKENGHDVLASLSPDGRRVAAYTGRDQVILADTLTGSILRSIAIPGIGDTSNQLAWLRFGPDSRTLVAVTSHHSIIGYQSEIQIWDGETGKPLVTLALRDLFEGNPTFPQNGCSDVEANVDLQVTALAFKCVLNPVSFDGTPPRIMVFGKVDLQSKAFSHGLMDIGGAVLIDFKVRNDANRMVASHYENGAYSRILLNTEAGVMVGARVPASMVSSSYSPDGRMFSAGEGNKIQFYSSDTGERVGGFDGTTGDFMYPGIFNANGELLALQMVTDDVWWVPPKGMDLVAAALARLDAADRTNAASQSLAFKD